MSLPLDKEVVEAAAKQVGNTEKKIWENWNTRAEGSTRVVPFVACFFSA